MSIRRPFGAGLLVVLGCLAAASFAGCGSSDSGAAAGGGGSGSGTAGSGGTAGSDDGGVDASDDQGTSGDGAAGADAGPHATPPAPGAAKPADGTSDVTFAVIKLYLGDTLRDGSLDSANGWKNYGYDLDGKISTATSSDLCKPRNDAAAKSVYPDGTDGIDNSFGKNILPILLGTNPDFSNAVNAGLDVGAPRMLLTLQKLGADADYNPIGASQYASLDLGSAPKDDGTDVFPIDPGSLLGSPPDVATPAIAFASGYLIGNTWVSGPPAASTLALTIDSNGQTGRFELPLKHAVISMDVAADRKSATNGTIAGVIAISDLEATLRRLAGQADPTLCSGPTVDAIIAQVDQAADILEDGTQDPSKTCDAVSIGIGFDAVAAQLGAAGSPVVTTDPCADAAP